MTAITRQTRRVASFERATWCLSAALLAGLALLGSGCARESTEYVDLLAEMESEGYEGSPDFEAEKARLEQEIAGLKKEVQKKVVSTANLGLYHKYLGLHYFTHGMYEYALGSFTEAIGISPTSALLFYYAGVSAAYVGKARVDLEERTRWLADAEAYYSRAIGLEPTLVRALYGYAILLDFELERPWDAKPLLERILAVEKKNFDAMFALARVHYQLNEIAEAADLYRRIERDSRSDDTRSAARQLLQQIEGGGVGL